MQHIHNTQHHGRGGGTQRERQTKAQLIVTQLSPSMHHFSLLTMNGLTQQEV